MGSKRKLLPTILDIVDSTGAGSAIDLFTGSGVVAYGIKALGLKIYANDYMAMAATLAEALIANDSEALDENDVEFLLTPNHDNDGFVQSTYQGLYFSDIDNQLIDSIRQNIKALNSLNKRALATASLVRACMKKRPRGIFTYVGYRYDDGRKDLSLSLEQQFRDAATRLNRAVFNNGQCNVARRGDALDVNWNADLVYVDPPYYSLYSDNEYVRRYHFVEGIACDWQGVRFQWHTKTKKFQSYPTPFSSRNGAASAFDELFYRHKDSIIVTSYSSNSLPDLNDMLEIMSRHLRKVDVIEVAHKYSFGTHGHRVGTNNNDATEYLFVGLPKRYRYIPAAVL